MPYLGPAELNAAKLKRRKAERRHRRFVEGCLDWLDEAVGPRYVHVRTGTRFEDPRPFDWRGWDVSPGHTYVVDLAPGREAVLDGYARSVGIDDGSWGGRCWRAAGHRPRASDLSVADCATAVPAPPRGR